jgi:transposase
MNLPETERARIAAAYGCVNVPPAVKVIPRGVSGLPDPWGPGMSWKQRNQISWDNRKPKKQQETRVDEIARMAERGATVKQIMAETGLNDGSVRKYLSLAKITPPPAVRVPDARTIAAKARAARFAASVAAGKTRDELAAEFGFKREYVKKYAFAVGVKLVRQYKSKGNDTRPMAEIEAETKARHDAIIQAFRDGQAIREIAATQNISERVIYRVLAAAGLREKRQTDSPETIAARSRQILAMHATGASYADIMAAVGCSYKQIVRAVQKAGAQRYAMAAE